MDPEALGQATAALLFMIGVPALLFKMFSGGSQASAEKQAPAQGLTLGRFIQLGCMCTALAFVVVIIAAKASGF